MLFSNLKKYNFFIHVLIIALLFVTAFMDSNEFRIAKLIWFFYVISLIIFYLGVILFFKKRTIKISFNLPDILLLSFYAWCFIRACFTPCIPFYNNQKLQLLTGCIVVYFFTKYTVTSKGILSQQNLVSIIISLLLISCLGQAIIGILQNYSLFKSTNPNFRITGTFGNPGPYAYFLAVAFPIAFERFFFDSSKYIFNLVQRYLSTITLIALIVIVPSTLNRASWIGIIVGCFLVFIYKTRDNYFKKFILLLTIIWKKVLFLVLAISIITAIGYGLYKQKTASADGRKLIWGVTVDKILEKPFWGVGLGKFAGEYNNWQAEWFQRNNNIYYESLAGTVEYALNDYLEVFVEVGIIGFLLFLFFLFFVLKNNLKGGSVAISASLVSLIVIANFGFPFNSLPTLIILFLITGIISGIENENSRIMQLTIPALKFNLNYKILCIGFCVSSFFVLINTKHMTNNYQIWNEAAKLYSLEAYPDAENELKKAYPYFIKNGKFLYFYGKCLFLNSKLIESAYILNESKKYYSNFDLYTTLGRVYEKIKLYKDSERFYKHAIFMVPSLFYPRYCLAKMYEISGQKQKALLCARELLIRKEKINVPAIEEMRKEMKLLELRYKKVI
jgi:O-antigen polymerase